MNKKQARRVCSALRAIASGVDTLETVADECFRTGPYTHGKGNVRGLIRQIRASLVESSTGDFIRAAKGEH